MDAVELHARLRDAGPRALAALARRGGDFAAVEDAMQEALVAAAAQWPAAGAPDDPVAWLVHVARRRWQDAVRAELARARREAVVVRSAALDATDDGDGALPDDRLQLLFMCCHPALSRSSAVALTLRAVGGLSTAAIARAYLVPEATMAQRITRAKQTLAAACVGFHQPNVDDRAARLGAVLHVLYLIFNEGYAASSGPTLVRVDLATEALRLMRAVHAQAPDDPEVAGLLALMLLTDARRAARTDADGGLVPLDEQDRARWDRAAIAEGTALVTAAFARGAVGPYQLQAAIAALHDEAPSTDATDWRQIDALYAVLERLADNPMVALSRAVAIAMIDGPAAGLARLAALDADPRLAGHHRLTAVRAHLHERAGDLPAARAAYRTAAAATASVPERDYLLARAARI